MIYLPNEIKPLLRNVPGIQAVKRQANVAAKSALKETLDIAEVLFGANAEILPPQI